MFWGSFAKYSRLTDRTLLRRRNDDRQFECSIVLALDVIDRLETVIVLLGGHIRAVVAFRRRTKRRENRLNGICVDLEAVYEQLATAM